MTEQTRIIPLTQGKVTVVDEADFDYLNQWKWWVDGKGNNWYAVRKENNRSFGMPQQLLGKTSRKLHIDHKDGDGLNNTRANLRFCTPRENQLNRRSHKNSTSVYKGVSWNPDRIRWQVYVDNKFQGFFMLEEEAARHYNAVAELAYGKFARLNKVEEL